jgi:Ca2+-binding EF-hand superfamily protein
MKLLPIAALATLSFSPLASAAGNGALDRAFAKADINNNLEVDRTEFLALQQRGKSWTDAAQRFNLADTDINGVLSLTEFRASNGGKEGRKPSRGQSFRLADLDVDGFLDPEEFALTLPQSQPWRKVLREFSRKDRNNDSLLSPLELGILTSKF